MNKESKLNLNAGDYAISHCDSDKTYTGLEVHKMLCDAYIAGSNDTLEDDDERIKNSLINLIKMSNEVGGFALHKWEADKMLAWIDKQGEKKPDYCHHKVDLSNCSEEYRKAYYDGWNNCNMQYSQCKSESNDVVKCLINGMKFYYEDNEEATWGTEKFSMKVKDILAWLENIPYTIDHEKREGFHLGYKAGLERLEIKTAEESLGVDSDTYNKIVDECIFDEQNDSCVKDYNNIDPHFGKSIDKTEPKFHEGEWITNGDYTWKIVEVKPLDYILQSQDGNVVDDTISHVDEQFHSFTIEDAKDGDVLICKGNIKNSNGIKYERICLFNNLNNAFFTLTKTSNFVEEYDIDVNIDYPDNTVPATKEQKEILFMAMADAGYTFDFDRKELKKIEPKTKENKGNIGGISPNWSEEDKDFLYDTLSNLTELKDRYGEGYGNVGKCIDWLKSLKGRVKPQPKQEWNEEDKYMYDILCGTIENTDINENTKYKLISWLKSLRPQNTYNPYKAVVESIAEMCKHYEGVSHIGLRDFYQNVKVKCKDAKEYDDKYPQNKWKPSDEQMHVLRNLAETSIGFQHSKTLISLYDDLKKL